MELVTQNDPILKLQCFKFDFIVPAFEPIQFAQDLIKCLYDNSGLGLAANQVGVQYQIFAMRGLPENYVVFNPRIVDESKETITLEEGCLTYPGLYVKVKRPRHIRARFQTPNGETKTETFTGMSARVFQHELDHLKGVIFYNKANRFHRDQAMRKWRLRDDGNDERRSLGNSNSRAHTPFW